MYYAGNITAEVVETVFSVQHSYMGEDQKPASVMVGVQSLAFGSLFEISVDAVLD